MPRLRSRWDRRSVLPDGARLPGREEAGELAKGTGLFIASEKRAGSEGVTSRVADAGSSSSGSLSESE